MNTNSELRNLTNEEVDAVAGGQISLEIGPAKVCRVDNAWDQWMFDYFGVCR